MKRKIAIILSIVLMITGICLSVSFILHKNHKNEQESKRYSEIKESVIKGVERNLKAQHPNCTIKKEFDENIKTSGSHYNSSFLINNGYIKKSELLDIDEKSYCDVYVIIKAKYEDQLNHQSNCNTYYKIYLKCKNYEDKGYINWG